MNYIYKETMLFTPVTTSLMTSNYIVTHHHSTIQVYDRELKPITERYFYEKILQIMKITDETFVVLFADNKLVQMNYKLESQCLRVVMGNKMDVYGEMVLVYDRIRASYFKYGDNSIEELWFNKIEAEDIFHIIFSGRQVPTLLIVCQRKGQRKCLLVALDSKQIVEEIEVQDGLLCIQRAKNIVILIYRNIIEIFYYGETTNLILHTALPRTEQTIYHVADNNSKSVMLEDVQIYARENELYIFNGDGCVYKIYLQMDEKNIWSKNDMCKY